MKLNIEQISDDGLELDYQEPAESFSYLRGDSGELAVNAPVRVTLLARKSSGGVTVKGNIRGTVTLSCSCCLITFSEDISHDFYYNCLPEAAMEEVEELSNEDADTYYYSGGEIDVTALVQEQVALSVPLRPLCKEDCKGLCPKCGADLNQGECGCQKEPVDIRLAALKGLKINNFIH